MSMLMDFQARHAFGSFGAALFFHTLPAPIQCQQIKDVKATELEEIVPVEDAIFEQSNSEDLFEILIPSTEVRYDSIKREFVQQQYQKVYIEEGGLQYSIDDVAYLSESPSPATFKEFLDDYYSEEVRRFSPGSELIRRPYATSIRIDIKTKGLIIRQSSYWESVTINVFFGRTERTAPPQSRLAARYGRCNMGQNTEICRTLREYHTIYEVRYVVEGLYASGGQPNSLNGYRNMEADGYHAEIAQFIGDISSRYNNYRSRRGRSLMN